jgi:16S rRNA (uracil1498-N3)-methyltransferase
VDGRDHAGVATFVSAETPRAGAALVLDEAAAHHARVRRLEVGDRAAVTDGRGSIGIGSVARVESIVVELAIETVATVPSLPALELLVPVADRDRTLWLAEKAGELGVSVWQPVMYARSRSVSPRGEGEAFARKVRARMASALEQSGGAWMPEIRADSTLEAAAARCAATRRMVLVRGAEPFVAMAPFAELAVAIGPEGGLEAAELDLLLTRGWRPASLGRSTLRFETAAVAAAAIVRAGQTG